MAAAMAGSVATASTSAIAYSAASSCTRVSRAAVKLSSSNSVLWSTSESVLSLSCSSSRSGRSKLPVVGVGSSRLSIRAAGQETTAVASKESASGESRKKKSPKETNVVVVGSTGYIGKFVVKELVNRGYNVIAVAREKSGVGGKWGKERTEQELFGAKMCFSDVTDAPSLEEAVRESQPNVDVVISCLASRGGGVKDSWLIDYTATKNSLDMGKALGASHFVLLSAICVQKPLLAFQKAKLKFEEELQSMAGQGMTYTIVRPTAFFKSLGGQVKSVQGGSPFIMFGDGALSACKPISEADLASFIADSVSDEEKINKILPIGGPGEALTPKEQAQILFRILGKEPKFVKVPIQIMDFFIGLLDFWKRFFPNLEDPAEFGKIGRYYAAESMLVLNPETGKYDADATPSYGSETLEEFFTRVARDGMVGQELGDQAVF